MIKYLKKKIKIFRLLSLNINKKMPTENLNKKELPISREKLEKMTMYLDGLNVDV
jgi:hypothetical protein